LTSERKRGWQKIESIIKQVAKKRKKIFYNVKKTGGEEAKIKKILAMKTGTNLEKARKNYKGAKREKKSCINLLTEKYEIPHKK